MLPTVQPPQDNHLGAVEWHSTPAVSGGQVVVEEPRAVSELVDKWLADNTVDDAEQMTALQAIGSQVKGESRSGGTEWQPLLLLLTGAAGTGKSFASKACLLYTSPSPRDATLSRMPSSA